MVPNDKYIFLHISSKKSSIDTDSERFVNNVVQSLEDMKKMFETAKENDKKKN